MGKLVNELDSAVEPILGTDKVLVSRDGVNLNQTTASKMPISTAVQTALDAISEVANSAAQPTASQASNTAIDGYVGADIDGKMYGLNGREIKPIRGVSSGMWSLVENILGAAEVSRTFRSHDIKIKVPVKRMKVVIPTFTNNSSATTVPARYDRRLQDNYRFQVAIERNPVQATTGIPAGRPLFTFNGSDIAEYFVSNNVWYLVSDWMEFSTEIAINESFRFWTTVEANPLAGAKIPVWGPKAASNYMQRYMGEVRSLSTSLITSGAAANATALTNTPASTNSSTNTGLTFGPCMILVESDAGIEFVSDFGSSFTAGFGEGFGTASSTNIAPYNTFGDSYGSPEGWFGFVERAVMGDTPHQMSVRASKPSQRGWEVIAGAAQGRLELLKLANPSVIVAGMLTNDLGETTTVTARATNTAYAKYADVISGGRSYICLHAGTSSSTLATLPDRPNMLVNDGTCVWWQVGTFTGTAQQAPRVIATVMQVNDIIKQYVPNAKIIGQLPPPRTTSSDGWSSATQTATTNWESGGKKAVVYNFMKSNFKMMGFSGLVDPNISVEDASAPNTTGIWLSVAGVQQVYTYDGTHATSFASANLANSVELALREI